MDFAIIGAGISGLACAQELGAAGHCVTLFDKGRGAGGRMSTRRLQTPLGDVSFDHGAQYFTARDPAFRRAVERWSELGIAAPWAPAGTDSWVGVPGMNAIVKTMAATETVQWKHLVTGIICRNGKWWLMSESGNTGLFDAVVLAIPAEQAAAILSLHDFSMTRAALMARSQPCWTGMFVFDRYLDGLPSVIRTPGDVAWAARNNEKPGRPGPEAWVVQASGSWSRARIEMPADEVAELLLGALSHAAGADLPLPVTALAHRWRFALSAGTGDGALWNHDLKLGVCGDWLLGPRVECAWLSGRMLARRCLGGGRSPADLAEGCQPLPSCA